MANDFCMGTGVIYYSWLAAFCYIIFVNPRNNQKSQFSVFSTCNHEWVFWFEIHFSHTNFELRNYWRLLITRMWRHVPAFRKKILLHSLGKKSKPRVEKHWEEEIEQTLRRFWGTGHTLHHGRQILTPLPWRIKHRFSPVIWSMRLTLWTWIRTPWRWLFTAETCSGNIVKENVFICTDWAWLMYIWNWRQQIARNVCRQACTRPISQ